jgi:DNA polymerase V
MNLVLQEKVSFVALPLYSYAVSAGVPSQGDDLIDGFIDVPDFLVSNRESSYVLKVSGDSMVDTPILDGDFVIVDGSVQPTHNKVVVASVNGEQTIKRLFLKNGRVMLLAENADYSPIVIHADLDVVFQGVVTASFRILK